MLRLLIVDDEKVIRESIQAAIDWNALGISVIGLCKNGVEAYETILDEYPDIVMTDIKMPGLSGLELIARISQAKLDTEFIILSGYGEFDFAKEAMRWGVKHYLLKPSTDAQLVEVLQSVKEDCYRKRILTDIQKKQRVLSNTVRQNMVRSTLIEALSGATPVEEVIDQRRRYLDFDNANYELYYFHYFEPQNVQPMLRALTEYQERNAGGLPLHAAYVRMTLTVFFEGYASDYADFERYCDHAPLERQSVAWERRHVCYPSLGRLLTELCPKLGRYDTITLMDGLHGVTLSNYAYLLKTAERLLSQMNADTEAERHGARQALVELIEGVDDPGSRQTLLIGLLAKCGALPEGGLAGAELLALMEDGDPGRRLLERLKPPAEPKSERKDFVDYIVAYVDENLDNPHLSLKWLAENQLYMNVDYLSKQFARQTGEKFSAFLTRKRIERAKALLLTCGGDRIYEIAQEVGCGNNPQYFSQIFKRAVGLTPTEYARRRGNAANAD